MPELFDLLEISIPSLIGSLIFSSIGLWLWRRAKGKNNPELRWIAGAMFLYSYFTPGPISTWSLGLLLCALAWWRWNTF